MPTPVRRVARSQPPIRLRAIVFGTIATLALLVGPVAVGTPTAHAQAPTSSPHPTATARLPTGTMIPALPVCTITGRMAVTPDRVQVGREVTATIEVRASCPEGLEARSAIIVVGGLDAEAAQAVVPALHILIDGLGEGGRSSAALVFAGDRAAPITFTDLPAGRDVIADEIARRVTRPASTGAEWTAAIQAAAAALTEVPPTQRPLLFVVDGAQPSGDVAPGLASLRKTINGLEGRLGLGLLIDVSPEAWLRTVGQGDAGPNATLIYVHPAVPTDAPSIVQNVVDALQAPIDFWRLDLGMTPELAVMRTSHAAAPDWAESNAYPWQRRPNTHQIAARMEVVLRAEQTGLATLGATLNATRRSIAVRRTAFVLPAPLCIFTASREAECDATATAPPPRSIPPASPPSRTATRTATPTATPFVHPPRPSPTSSATGEITHHVAYLPVTWR